MSIWNYLQLCDVLGDTMQVALHSFTDFALHVSFSEELRWHGISAPLFVWWPEQGNSELWHVQWGHGGLVQTMLCVGKLGWAELDQNKTSRSTETLAPGPREALMDLWICRCLEWLFWGQGQQDIHIYVQLIHHCILQVLMLAPENVPRMVCSY